MDLTFNTADKSILVRNCFIWDMNCIIITSKATLLLPIRRCGSQVKFWAQLTSPKYIPYFGRENPVYLCFNFGQTSKRIWSLLVPLCIVDFNDGT